MTLKDQVVINGRRVARFGCEYTSAAGAMTTRPRGRTLGPVVH